MAASVWMKSSYTDLFNCRPSALTMPIVTVRPMPNGLPIASTTSPTLSGFLSAMVMLGRFDAVDLEHRQIGFGIAADHARVDHAAVVQHDSDFLGALDHVIVGDDIAVGAHDHAGTRGFASRVWSAAPTAMPGNMR